MVVETSRHPVVLRGAEAHRGSRGPLLLERTDADFLAAVLSELETGGEKALPAIASDPPDPRLPKDRDSNKVLKLQQPVHRTFYIALFEIVCDIFGQPRLDPQRIDSAGLVIRRIANDRMQGWREGGKQLKGWIDFRSSADADMDPDPKLRPALSAGHPEIDRQLALNFGLGPLSETFSPLFVAPPAVCEATGRTIVYGLVPLASAEQSVAPAQFPAFDDDARTEIRNNLPRLFRKNGSRFIPLKSQVLKAADANQPGMAEFVNMLRQMSVEFDAFGATASAQALLWELNSIRLDFKTLKQAPAGDFLRDATRVLVESDPTAQVEMPVGDWPDIDGDREDRILGLVVSALRARLAVVSPHEGRFDDLNRQYRIRGFVRVKDTDGCPPETVWSEYTEPFRITPWFEAGNAQPVRIILPDATDKNFLKSVKPNVSFVVPSGLFNKLQQTPAKNWLSPGASGSATNIGLDWICSFSIPIITLCAFIVLYIFLTLFDLIFQWLLWVKICIPFPVRKPRPSS